MKTLFAVAMVLASFAAASAIIGSSSPRSDLNTVLGMQAMYSHRNSGTGTTGSGNVSAKNYTATDAIYAPPDVVLIDRHGKKVRLAELLSQPRPVFLQFIFTSCTTLCPILSATFSQAQNDIAGISKDYEMISISIDPEYDTPERLDVYARRYHPAGNWVFLTGKKEDIFRVLKAFDALYQKIGRAHV